MDGDALTRVAERAGARYGQLLEALRGLLPLVALNPWGDRARLDLQARAYAMVLPWLEDERALIEAALLQAGQEALDATTQDLGIAGESLTDDEQAHLAELSIDLENLVRVQLERDISLLAGALREIALRGAISARSRGVSRTGVLAPLIADAMSRMRFEFADRAGKRWPSQRYLKTLWRQALVIGWNETALLVMADHGLDQAVIDHPDPNHSENGTLISLTEAANGLLWSDVKPDIFHPNTSAWLKPV